MTAFNSKSGGFQLTTVGRVQTPTLAILVEREEKIRAFVPRDYWEVLGTFRAAGGEYDGRWFDEKFKKVRRRSRRARRAAVGSRRRARAIAAKCEGKPGIVTEETKPSTQAAPLLYDLTSLQREANGRFGFSARTTLSLAQALYEKHKVLTYPRTDSRALPEDYIDDGQGDAGGAARGERLRRVRRPDPQGANGSGPTSASSTTARSPITSRSSRRLQRPKNLNEARGQALRPGRQALPRGVLSAAPNTC